MTKQEALNLLERNHRALMTRLNNFSDREMENTRAFGDWTLRDLLAHVVTWENVCVHYLDELAAGRSISPLDLPVDAFNARAAEQQRQMSLAQVRVEADASYARVRERIAQLNEARLDEEMRGPWLGVQDILPLHKIIAIDTWEHYQMHVNDLAKLGIGN